MKMNKEKDSEIQFRDQLTTAILSSPLVYVPTSDYGFVDKSLGDILPVLGITNDSIIQYDVQLGFVNFATKEVIDDSSLPNLQNVLTIAFSRRGIQSKSGTGIVKKLQESNLLLLKNVVKMDDGKDVQGVINDSQVQLLLQTFVQQYRLGRFDQRKTVVMVAPAPVSALPFELKDLVTVIDILPPKFAEIQRLVDNIPVSNYQDIIRHKALKDDLCRTLMGLHRYEIEQILGAMKSRTGGFITDKSNAYALEEKQRIVRKSGIIEVVIPEVTFDDVGGLDVLRDDMKDKAVVFQNLGLATDNKLPFPKGILIIGMPGCGKSMIAKSIASEFGVSLLRLDVSRLMGQYVGQSEENLRRALRTAEAAHPCVLWIDEIEKAFHGANSGNANENDSLVMRMMGYFLTWMQERKTAVYIIATANDTMRPEFMRKGRFDEIYFVDFPSKEERKSIFENKIHKYQSSESHTTIFDFSEVNIDTIAEMSGDEGGALTGAEIEYVINSVVERKFVEFVKIKIEDRPPKMIITSKNIEDEIINIKKHALYKQSSEEDGPINKLRELKKLCKAASYK